MKGIGNGGQPLVPRNLLEAAAAIEVHSTYGDASLMIEHLMRHCSAGLHDSQRRREGEQADKEKMACFKSYGFGFGGGELGMPPGAWAPWVAGGGSGAPLVKPRPKSVA